jgi:basic amino acid/polyamine antiporter, APA family
MSTRTLGFVTAVSIVIANMIGTGVFTSLGFQVMSIHSVFALLCLWVFGGIIALCGALTYGELAGRMPVSGGEYQYLSKIYHPVVGFLSGWTSATAGFSAPVALAAMALGTYFSKVTGIGSPTVVAITIVVLLTGLHLTSRSVGARVQNVFTVFKVLLIIAFVSIGLAYTGGEEITVIPQITADPASSWTIIFSSGFAVSLVYVSYAYSGWNASTYIAGEIKDPQRNLPRSLFRGTLVVTILYVLLNYVFLKTVSVGDLSGKLEIGYLSAEKLFGISGGKIMGSLITILLVSSVSSMIFAGPRVAQAMGQDLKALAFLSVTKRGVPYSAIILQSIVTIILILTGSFEKVLTYVGFTLNLFTFLTVAAIFVLRKRDTSDYKGYKTWGYPFTPLLFLGLSAWSLYFIITNRPTESLMGFVTILAGLPIYFISSKKAVEDTSVLIDTDLLNNHDEAIIKE